MNWLKRRIVGIMLTVICFINCTRVFCNQNRINIATDNQLYENVRIKPGVYSIVDIPKAFYVFADDTLYYKNNGNYNTYRIYLIGEGVDEIRVWSSYTIGKIYADDAFDICISDWGGTMDEVNPTGERYIYAQVFNDDSRYRIVYSSGEVHQLTRIIDYSDINYWDIYNDSNEEYVDINELIYDCSNNKSIIPTLVVNKEKKQMCCLVNDRIVLLSIDIRENCIYAYNQDKSIIGFLYQCNNNYAIPYFELYYEREYGMDGDSYACRYVRLN